jgi:pimeloyl-ACP methyl ester carboxylesterase
LDAGRVLYLGESLGGAVALALALTARAIDTLTFAGGC